MNAFSGPVLGNIPNQSLASLKSRSSNGILGLLPCEHVYHFYCIWEWLLHKKICPTCKTRTEPDSIATISESAFVEYYENKCKQTKKPKHQKIELDPFRPRSYSDPRCPRNEPFQFRSRANTTGSNMTKDVLLKRARSKQRSFKNQNGERRIYLPQSSLTNSRQNLGNMPEIIIHTSIPEVPTRQNPGPSIVTQGMVPEQSTSRALYPDVDRLRALGVMDTEYRLRTRSNVSDLSILYI